jgi:hypothetical protein
MRADARIDSGYQCSRSGFIILLFSDTRRAQTARLIFLPKTLVEIGSVQTPNPLGSDILNILVIMRYIFMEI